MKIWIDRKGNVQSFGVGSIEEQQHELIAIMAYIQRRVDVSETMVKRAAQKSAPKREPDDGVIGGTD